MTVAWEFPLVRIVVMCTCKVQPRRHGGQSCGRGFVCMGNRLPIYQRARKVLKGALSRSSILLVINCEHRDRPRVPDSTSGPFCVRARGSLCVKSIADGRSVFLCEAGGSVRGFLAQACELRWRCDAIIGAQNAGVPALGACQACQLGLPRTSILRSLFEICCLDYSNGPSCLHLRMVAGMKGDSHASRGVTRRSVCMGRLCRYPL
jgi:hypothetical protein